MHKSLGIIWSWFFFCETATARQRERVPRVACQRLGTGSRLLLSDPAVRIQCKLQAVSLSYSPLHLDRDKIQASSRAIVFRPSQNHMESL